MTGQRRTGRAAAHVRSRDALAAEWIKVATLRSTWMVLALALLAALGVCALVSLNTAADWTTMTSTERAEVDPLEDALLGLYLAQIAVGAFGVLVATADYATGTIAQTLLAVPRRAHVLAAKLTVVAAIVTAVGVIAVVAALWLAAALLPPPLQIAVDGTTIRVVAGTVIGLVAAAIVGTALGMVTRSTAAALGVLVTIMVLPAVVVFSPELTTYLPARVVQALMVREASPESHLLTPAPAAIVLTAYLLASIVRAYASFRYRDA